MEIEKRKNDIDFRPGKIYKKSGIYDVDDYFESTWGTVVFNNGWVYKFMHTSFFERLCYYRCKLYVATKETYEN